MRELRVDMVAGITTWASRAGISLAWLFTGDGQMKGGRRGDLWVEWLAEADQRDLTEELGRLAYERGIVERLLDTLQDPAGRAEVLERLRPALPARPAPPAAAPRETRPVVPRRGYVTVPPEQVTGPDWQRRFVPVIGAIAAGEGLDTLEAETHPPQWLGEYLVYEGAPPGAVAVRIRGDSMTPDFRPGDMVIVDTHRHVEQGLACVILERHGEREPRLKIISRKGRRLILKSRKGGYPPESVPISRVAAAYGIIVRLPRASAAPEAIP